MCDKGDKLCPICTEEMDLTDQQLKPCQCGYEICVWCWHHIMEMAEKDGTEGRCPACRTPYDKERIVAMSANCQRLVAEMKSQHKSKMQKLKPKASEGRKHLSDVRVIQRNLVYIIGLPLNLADEDLLQRREYFGRYGKVLKVSISRTAAGAIQHSANNSCCVYITYSKEAEAVRCIQSVHCFVLEGRSLRACFGTTKYCHAWLKNVPCNNRDCLYLHDFGSQEDSFTKDELVLAFARSRVPQIIGATNNLQRRSGNALPPSADDHRHTTMSLSTKPVAKSPLDKSDNQIKGSFSDTVTGNPTTLPSMNSWVMRASGTLPPTTSSSCSGGFFNRKPEVSNDPQALVSKAVSMERSTLAVKRRSLEAEYSSEVQCNGMLAPSELTKHYVGVNSQTSASNINNEVILEKIRPVSMSSSNISYIPLLKDNDLDRAAPSTNTSFPELVKPLHCPNFDKAGSLDRNEDVQGLCSGLSSINIHCNLEHKYPIPTSDNLSSSHNLISSSGKQCLQQDNEDCSDVVSASPAYWEDHIVEDLLNGDYEQPKSSKGINDLPSVPHSPCLIQKDNSSCNFWQQDEIYHQNYLAADCRHVWIENEEVANPLASGNPVLSDDLGGVVVNCRADLDKSSDYFNVSMDARYGQHVESKDNVKEIDDRVASNMGDSSIISNILSLELDAWEDPSTLTDSLVKLNESDEHDATLKAPTMRKVQEKNQSRFSFARQDEFLNKTSSLEHSFVNSRHAPSKYFSSGGFMGSNDTNTEKHQLVFSPSSSLESDIFLGGQSFTHPKVSVSQAHVSTPPGFSLPSRTPPGFPSLGRVGQDSCCSVKHPQQAYAPPTGNIGSTGDGEFFDPAILEVGKGMLSERLNNASLDIRRTSLPPFCPYEDDARFKLLRPQSVSAQNFGFADHLGNRLSSQNDAYRFSPRPLDQLQPNNPSMYAQLPAQRFSNSHSSNSLWGGWNDVKNFSALGMPEVVNNERLGFDRFLSSYGNTKF
ncbi:CCR4-NOT transcription complex subunit 4 [Quillaja saponaria]|uniref:CCR4-NOT transcription complex subunit 4 n=1 Tax=Quillaja saponaria TaxID=32244 RepID=A0AAD7VIH1_QUISA|nr:CCR4-NOT transcription complex subunit 4 [Quillaja saponaria]